MNGRLSNGWKWVQLFAVGLMILGAFAPLPEDLGPILSILGSVILLVWIVVTKREERQEREADQSAPTWPMMVRRFLNWTLPPALALGLLSLGTLTSISDLWDKVFSWVAFAILLAYVGVPMWEYYRARHADLSSGAISSSDQM